MKKPGIYLTALIMSICSLPLWADSDSIGSPEEQGLISRYDSVNHRLAVNGRIHTLTDDVANLLALVWAHDKTRLLPGKKIEYSATEIGGNWDISAVAIPFSASQTEPLIPELENDLIEAPSAAEDAVNSRVIIRSESSSQPITVIKYRR